MTLISNYFVSVVVPLRNDGDLLESFVDELVGVVRGHYQNYEIVLVDDGSTDETAQIVGGVLQRHECMRYLRLSRAFGTETAILAGLDTVIGDVVVVVQPETDPTAMLPRFVEKARAVNGIVFGLRTKKLREPLSYSIGRRMFTRIVRNLLEIDLPERATLFMALTRQTLNAVLQIKDKSRAMRIFGSFVGFSHHFLEYEPIQRRSTMRPKPLLDGLERAVSLIVTNSTHPLRLVSLLGVVMAFFNVLYIVYVILIHTFKEHVAEGWTTTSLQQAVMFLFVFAILSVLCEYVGRLLEESRDRPLYFIAQERTSSVMIRDEDRRNVVVEST
jgi:dolichol-phosphate mannosyltransferase